MKSTALAVGIFLGSALAIPPVTPVEDDHISITPIPSMPAWDVLKRAASSLLLPKPTTHSDFEPLKRDNIRDETSGIRPGKEFDRDNCRYGTCGKGTPHHHHHSPGAGRSYKGRAPIDNAEEKGCMPLIQVTIPWYRTFVLYNCECGDECPQVKRGCRLDAFIEIYTGNTLILYTCPPMCVHGAMSLSAGAAMEKRGLESKDEDACYSIMDDGINNAPPPYDDKPHKPSKSSDSSKPDRTGTGTSRGPQSHHPSDKDDMDHNDSRHHENSPEYSPIPGDHYVDDDKTDSPSRLPICLGFTKKLYVECVNRCSHGSDNLYDSCGDKLGSVYEDMLKSLRNSVGKQKNMDKRTDFVDLELAADISRARMPKWCSWEPIPVEDDGNHGQCGDMVREFCKWHDCHDG